MNSNSTAMHVFHCLVSLLSRYLNLSNIHSVIRTDLMSLFCFWRRFQREESKIIAWESLQKAKAEAAIRTLEVFYSSQLVYILNFLI